MLMMCFNCGNLIFEIDETKEDRPLVYSCAVKNTLRGALKLDVDLMHLCCMQWISEGKTFDSPFIGWEKIK